jgi:addiction module HigA family antidote
MSGKRKYLDPICPGEVLREEFMKPLGISMNRLARDLLVPAGRISAIARGKRAITADTALRLGRYFGIPAQMWMSLQAEYDLRLARRALGAELERRVPRHAAQESCHRTTMTRWHDVTTKDANITEKTAKAPRTPRIVNHEKHESREN